jgi:NAD(P)-dependent dehydrogenase (short-subunit alcohol dehydrogenase family)
MARLDGRVAICTGGASGIALAAARRFAEEGARVVLADLDGPAALAAAAALRAGGHDALGVACDVAVLDDVDAAVRATLDAFGRVDVLLNAAGGSRPGDAPIAEVDLSLYEPTFASNVKGTMHACRAVIPAMSAQGRGSIINLTSLFALQGNHTLHLYGAAKGAVISLTREVAARHAADGIRCNVVVPGTVLTPRVKALFDANTDEHGHNAAASAMGFDEHPASVCTPEELAPVLAFLASDDAAVISGAVIHANGGMTAW